MSCHIAKLPRIHSHIQIPPQQNSFTQLITQIKYQIRHW
jgi:hypothetical protein